MLLNNNEFKDFIYTADSLNALTIAHKEFVEGNKEYLFYWWQFFINKISVEEIEALYNAYAIPEDKESRNILDWLMLGQEHYSADDNINYFKHLVASNNENSREFIEAFLILSIMELVKNIQFSNNFDTVKKISETISLHKDLIVELMPFLVEMEFNFLLQEKNHQSAYDLVKNDPKYTKLKNKIINMGFYDQTRNDEFKKLIKEENFNAAFLLAHEEFLHGNKQFISFWWQCINNQEMHTFIESILNAYSIAENEEERSGMDCFILGIKQYVAKEYELAYENLQQAYHRDMVFAQTVMGLMHEQGLGCVQSFLLAKWYYDQAIKQNDSFAMVYLANLYWEHSESIKNEDDNPPEIIHRLTKQSLELGNTNALGLYVLTNCYLQENTSYEVNLKKHAENAAELGDAEAISGLARFCCDERNYKRAMELYKCAIALGSINAKRNLADMIKEGKGVEADLFAAKQLYQEALDGGDVLAKYYLKDTIDHQIDLCINEDRYADALAIIRNECKEHIKDYADKLYFKARGYEQSDPQRSIKLYQSYIALVSDGIHDQHKHVQMTIAELYELGKTGAADFVQARAFYQKAAEQNSVEAMFCLAVMLEQGKGGKKDLVAAKKWYGQAAKDKHVEAMFHLATLLLQEKNNAEALSDAWHWSMRAADSGHVESMVQYAYLLEKGIGNKKFKNLPKDYYKKAADLGHGEASYLYATYCEKSNDLEEAKKYLYHAIKCGHEDAIYKLASLLDNHHASRDELVQARKLYQQAADLYDSKAIIRLAKMCEFGTGGAVDFEQARKLYCLAVDEVPDNTYALNRLTDMFWRGLGGPVDLRLARQYCQMAVDLNNAEARKNFNSLVAFEYYDDRQDEVFKFLIKQAESLEAFKLAHEEFIRGNKQYLFYWMDFIKNHKSLALPILETYNIPSNTNQRNALDWYIQGMIDYVNYNFVSARECFTKAAKMGLATAQNDLGYLFQFGFGGEKNKTKAMIWYEQALASGDASALINLSLLLEKDDFEKAKQIYAESSDFSNVDCQKMLGDYEYALKNYSKAAQHYQYTAEMGDITSLCRLAQMYVEGKYVEKDVKTAIQLYVCAADLGYMPARTRLQDLGVEYRSPYQRTWKESWQSYLTEQKNYTSAKVKKDSTNKNEHADVFRLYEQAHERYIGAQRYLGTNDFNHLYTECFYLYQLLLQGHPRAKNIPHHFKGKLLAHELNKAVSNEFYTRLKEIPSESSDYQKAQEALFLLVYSKRYQQTYADPNERLQELIEALGYLNEIGKTHNAFVEAMSVRFIPGYPEPCTPDALKKSAFELLCNEISGFDALHTTDGDLNYPFKLSMTKDCLNALVQCGENSGLSERKSLSMISSGNYLKKMSALHDKHIERVICTNRPEKISIIFSEDMVSADAKIIIFTEPNTGEELARLTRQANGFSFKGYGKPISLKIPDTLHGSTYTFENIGSTIALNTQFDSPDLLLAAAADTFKFEGSQIKTNNNLQIESHGKVILEHNTDLDVGNHLTFKAGALELKGKIEVDNQCRMDVESVIETAHTHKLHAQSDVIIAARALKKIQGEIKSEANITAVIKDGVYLRGNASLKARNDIYIKAKKFMDQGKASINANDNCTLMIDETCIFEKNTQLKANKNFQLKTNRCKTYSHHLKAHNFKIHCDDYFKSYPGTKLSANNDIQFTGGSVWNGGQMEFRNLNLKLNKIFVHGIPDFSFRNICHAPGESTLTGDNVSIVAGAVFNAMGSSYLKTLQMYTLLELGASLTVSNCIQKHRLVGLNLSLDLPNFAAMYAEAKELCTYVLQGDFKPLFDKISFSSIFSKVASIARWVLKIIMPTVGGIVDLAWTILKTIFTLPSLISECYMLYSRYQSGEPIDACDIYKLLGIAGDLTTQAISIGTQIDSVASHGVHFDIMPPVFDPVGLGLSFATLFAPSSSYSSLVDINLGSLFLTGSEFHQSLFSCDLFTSHLGLNRTTIASHIIEHEGFTLENNNSLIADTLDRSGVVYANNDFVTTGAQHEHGFIHANHAYWQNNTFDFTGEVFSKNIALTTDHIENYDDIIKLQGKFAKFHLTNNLSVTTHDNIVLDKTYDLDYGLQLSGSSVNLDHANIHSKGTLGFTSTLFDINAADSSVSSDKNILLHSNRSINNLHGRFNAAKIYLYANQDIVNTAGNFNASDYLYGYAGNNIINQCEEKDVQGACDIMKEYTSGEFHGGTHGLSLHANNQLINDGSVIGSIGDQDLFGNNGIINKSREHQFKSYDKRWHTLGKNKHTVEYKTQVQKPLIYSVKGSNTLLSPHGDIYTHSAGFSAGNSNYMYGKNVILDGAIAQTILKKNTSNAFGADKSSSVQVHQTAIPTVVLSQNDLDMQAENTIDAVNAAFYGGGLLSMKAKNVNLSAPILTDYGRENSYGVSFDLPGLDDLESIDAPIADFNHLLHSSDAEETTANAWNVLNSSTHAFNTASSAILSPSSLATAQVGFHHHSAHYTSQRVAENAGVHFGSLLIDADHVNFANGVPVVIDYDATIHAKTFTQSGAACYHSMQSNDQSFAYGMDFTGNQYASMNFQRAQSNGTNYTNQLFSVGGTLSTDIDDWRMDAANTNAYHWRGHVNHLTAQSRADTYNARSEGIAADTTGNVSVNFSRTQDRYVAQKTGVSATVNEAQIDQFDDEPIAIKTSHHHVHTSISSHAIDEFERAIDNGVALKQKVSELFSHNNCSQSAVMNSSSDAETASDTLYNESAQAADTLYDDEPAQVTSTYSDAKDSFMDYVDALNEGVERGRSILVDRVKHPIDTLSNTAVMAWDGFNAISDLALGVSTEGSRQRNLARGAAINDTVIQVVNGSGPERLKIASTLATVGLFSTTASYVVPGTVGLKYSRVTRRAMALPEGYAYQSNAADALSAKALAQSGAPLFRAVKQGFSRSADNAYYWSLENPLYTENYAKKMGSATTEFDHVDSAQLRPGAPIITRPAPPYGNNPGGGIEVIVDPNTNPLWNVSQIP
ncbi:MAG: tetratricopeptide repeat protein [Gammaproteobacteria bacterium]|nr:tetratricopeptide repeat protein [Gammaproteobacteria bacterium]